MGHLEMEMLTIIMAWGVYFFLVLYIVFPIFRLRPWLVIMQWDHCLKRWRNVQAMHILAYWKGIICSIPVCAFDSLCFSTIMNSKHYLIWPKLHRYLSIYAVFVFNIGTLLILFKPMDCLFINWWFISNPFA